MSYLGAVKKWIRGRGIGICPGLKKADYDSSRAGILTSSGQICQRRWQREGEVLRQRTLECALVGEGGEDQQRGSDIEEAIQGRSVRLCGVWASCLISDALEKMWAP